MNISSLFQKKQLTPVWSYSTAGILWRLLFSETNFIVGEDRDTEKKQVSFFCLNASNGDVLWKDVSFAEAWWIGIEGIIHDKVFLHGFKRPDMPEHGKIIAVDLGTGRELWHNNDYAFLFATADKVFAFRDFFDKRLYYELDAATGEFMQEHRDAPVDLYGLKGGSHGRSDFLFPEMLNESTAEYPLLSPKILKYCDMSNVRGSVEFVQSNGRVAFSYHAQRGRDGEGKADVLENRLCIIDETSGKQLYADVLNASTPAAVPDSFFVDSATLYYIKEKNTIVALPLLGEAQ
jgi:outer membrane protein assembly factor BamB